MAKKSEKAPSLKPPKAWWDKTYAGVKKGNPKLNDEAIRKIVGDMWYNEMKRGSKVKARKEEGKTYGKAPIKKGQVPGNIGRNLSQISSSRVVGGFIQKGHKGSYGRKSDPVKDVMDDYREFNKAHVDNDIEKSLKFPKTGKDIKAAIPNKIKECNEEISKINDCIADLTSVVAGTKDLTVDVMKKCSEYTYVFEDYPVEVQKDAMVAGTTTPQPEDPKKLCARAISSMQRKIKWKQETIDKLNKIVNNLKDATKYELNEWELEEYGF